MIYGSRERTFIHNVRAANEAEFGPSARQAVQRLLDAGLPHPWMYVYELIQNARDAGARRVWWQIDGTAIVFQHNGTEPLDEKHVRGLAQLGKSTKGLAAVGFMGVGFKSVFARFRVARVSGFGWRFRFDVGAFQGALGVTIPEWMDTFRPSWDEDVPSPDPGYTTLFRLERPAEPSRAPAADFESLASSADVTPLAVLGLRGLEEVRVGSVTWRLAAGVDEVHVRRADSGERWQWRVFRSRFRPDDHAMRRFLEVRQEPRDDLDASGERLPREVVALLPLDASGVPVPPDHGRVYSTLPTQVRHVIRLHLQADWLVNVDRQNLRDVAGDPWQEAIVSQLPELLRQLLTWLAGESAEVRRCGYAVLDDPTQDDGPLGTAICGLRDAIAVATASEPIVPTLSGGERTLATVGEVGRLPGRIQKNFGAKPTWRPDILFRRSVLDEDLLGTRGVRFAAWLGWGSEIDRAQLADATGLSAWWDAIPEDQRVDALLALWDGIADQQWHDVAVVPVDSGEWKRADQTEWLTEEPPSLGEPGGATIIAALAPALPGTRSRVPAVVRSRVNQAPDPTFGRDSVEARGAKWLKDRHIKVTLKDAILKACTTTSAASPFPFVALLKSAMHRGERRQDLVPRVWTEAGAVEPDRALIADPLVEGGRSRRALFPSAAALVGEYSSVSDPRGAVLFLERLGVPGDVALLRRDKWLSRDNKEHVARQLDLTAESVAAANNDGYTVVDLDLPFDAVAIPPDALQEWLSRGHARLRDQGRRWADSFYHGWQKDIRPLALFLGGRSSKLAVGALPRRRP